MNPRTISLSMALLCACSAEVEPAALDPFVGPLASGNFLARFAAARCASEFACHDAQSVSTRRLFATEADCVTEALTQENTPIDDDLVALSRGATVRFDAATAQRCLDETARTCFDFGFRPADCRMTFRGTLPAGSTCWRNEECVDDAWCDHARDASGAPTCPGTCRPRAALGAACGDTPCASAGTTGEPYCYGQENPRCVDLQSGPAANEGQFCGMRELSATLVTRTRCRDGLVCVSTSDGLAEPLLGDGEGVCVRSARIGEACRSRSPGCGDDAECIDGVCQRTVVQTRVGAPCDAGTIGPRLCSPVRYLVCVDGTCQRLGDGSLGSRCVKFCQRGLICERETCRPQHAAGEPCRFGDECASGSCDDANPFEDPPGHCRARYCSR